LWGQKISECRIYFGAFGFGDSDEEYCEEVSAFGKVYAVNGTAKMHSDEYGYAFEACFFQFISITFA